jgi:hypothetical protein
MALLRALGFENSTWHTRLGTPLLIVNEMGAFFASQKTGLSAAIPRPAYGGTAGFPLQSLARRHIRQNRMWRRSSGKAGARKHYICPISQTRTKNSLNI